MVAPRATGADFDVLLAFSLDEEANKRVQARVTTIHDELKRIQGEALKAGKALNTMGTGAAQKTEAAQKQVTKLGIELAKLGERAQQSSKKVNEGIDSNIRKLKELEETAKRVRQQSALVSGAAARGAAIFGQGLLAGGAVVGGILAEANRYAKEEEGAKRATAATREWMRATEDLARARRRVDAILLRESLPLLQEAARIAERAADVIEKHPEIVQAALKTGLVVAGLSAVGLAVSKGIKLVADTTYIVATATELLAARIHKKAAEDELKAASAKLITNRADDLRKAFGIGTAPAAGAAGSGLALPLAGIVASTAVTVAVAKGLNYFNDVLSQKLGPTVAKVTDFIVSWQTSTIPGLSAVRILLREADGQKTKIGDLVRAILKIGDAAETASARTGTTGGRAPVRPETSPNRMSTDTQQALVDAWSSWQEDDAKLVREAAARRVQIVADAEKQIAAAIKQYSSQRVSINARFDQQRAELISGYADDLKKAEQDYARNRAEIIRAAGEDIQKIEADHQETLRKMTLDHNDRVSELVAARDALGLVKEEQRFNRERSESERDINREISQRRQDTARRLQELAEEYALERAQRQEQFQQALKENEVRRQEELKAAAQAHAEQLAQIREQRAAQLRELQEGLNAERIRRREMFIAQIRDLDASLLGERNLKVKYYNLMLQDASNWLNAYRLKLASAGSLSGTTGTIGTRDSGGYADRGLYRLAWNGQREFVLSGSSTRAAEQIIGAQLNQDNLLRALTGMGSRQMNYYDQRRMERPLSKDDRNMYEQGAMDALNKMLEA